MIRDHLSGRQTVGLYPLQRDETCWLLAADFDKEVWREDALAYLAACDALRVPAILEHSRSGRGAHVWTFFEAPVAAERARKLGCVLLTRATEHRHQVGLGSYDQLFPNQDTLPKGGFGNLITLPLQGGPRRQGNSVFVNWSFEAYPDQWALLATGRYAGEGFDHAQLDTLLLALPVSWKGTVRQYAGRLNRVHPDKLDVRIYDYVDVNVPVLTRMYERRLKGYRIMGYRVQPNPS